MGAVGLMVGTAVGAMMAAMMVALIVNGWLLGMNPFDLQVIQTQAIDRFPIVGTLGRSHCPA